MLVGLILLLAGKTLGQQSNQPFSSYWFPGELLEWQPDDDPHAIFNRSSVPLARRFLVPGERLGFTDPRPGITSLVASHPTSNHPSQGFESVKNYAFPFWAYLDYFVQWGGSSGEGLIVSPAAPWIDAAHRNGVQVLGTVFFPPNVYGGKEEWVREFLLKGEDGTFPIADKLLEVAAYYGFEGWFINQETHGLSVPDATAMREFMKYYQQKAAGAFKIMWYDAMIDDGRVIWQEELNEHNQQFYQDGDDRVSDIMFLDFGWHAINLEDTRELTLKLDRSPWDMYAGIDVQSRSYRSYANWGALYDEDSLLRNTSVALYWPNSTFDISETKTPEEVYENELKFWNGTTTNISGRDWHWKGFTGFVEPRSTLTKTPFITHFNYGLGYQFFHEGRVVSDAEWHNLTVQDILPHWQWGADTSRVKVRYDFSDAYEGGSSLKLELVAKDSPARIPLYKTDIKVKSNTHIVVRTKSIGRIRASVILTFANGENVSKSIDGGASWTQNVLGLGSHLGKILTSVSLELHSDDGNNTTFSVGELAILEEPQTPTVLEVSGELVSVTEAYVHWTYDTNTRYGDFYQVLADGTTHWLKRSRSSSIYLSQLKEMSGKSTKIEVIPISSGGTRGQPVIVDLE